MTTVARYLADNALECAIGDTDRCPLVELVLVIGNDDKPARLVG